MKKPLLSAFFIYAISISAFGGGDLELVNTQEIELDNIIDVKILYSSEKVSVFMGTANTLIIKEYMNEDNNKYFAKINKSGNTVTIENGQRPFRPILNLFNRRLEVYLPVSYGNMTLIRTSSGNIDTSDLLSSGITIESSSGKITVKSITADDINIKTSSGGIDIDVVSGKVSVESSSGRIDIKQAKGVLTSRNSSGSIHGENIQGDTNLYTSSGGIVFGKIIGNVSAESSSGNIKLNAVTGSVNAKTTSGGIDCTVDESAGNVTLNTTSGGVKLFLPVNLNFSFSSRTLSGRLTTPFSGSLSNPVSDRSLTQGVIGGNNSENIPSVNIRTNSGFIRVEWT